MKKNNSTTENKATTATKEVDIKKATEKKTKSVKTAKTEVKQEEPLVDAQTPIIPIKDLTPHTSGELIADIEADVPSATEKLPRKEKKRNKAQIYGINNTIPCKTNVDRNIAKAERRARHKEAIARRKGENLLNTLHHKTNVAEKALANYRARVKEKEEIIAKKKEHIKALTPERLAELAKRRIARMEKRDEEIVKGKQKNSLQLAHFIAEQSKRNVKKTISKTPKHTPERVAEIKAECEARKAAKKALNIAAAKLAKELKEGMTPNQYTIITSFVRPDGTTFTENRRVKCPTEQQAIGHGKAIFDKYMKTNQKRSKMATKVGVYPDFGNDWCKQIWFAEATAKQSETVLETPVTKEAVKESKEKYTLAANDRKNIAKKPTKAEKLLAKYTTEEKAAA